MPSLFRGLELEAQRQAALPHLREAYSHFADEKISWNLYDLVNALIIKYETELGYWKFTPEDLYLTSVYLQSADRKWRAARLPADHHLYPKYSRLAQALENMVIGGTLSLSQEFAQSPVPLRSHRS